MEEVEERRRRLAAMREQADAQTADEGTVSSLPPPVIVLANPFEDSSAEVKKSSNFDFYTDPLAGYSGSKRRKPGAGVLQTPSEVTLKNDASRQASAGLLPPPPHLEHAGAYPPPSPPSWQPIVYQPPYSNPGFGPPQPPSGWQPVGSQMPPTSPAFAHPQPPAQFQPHLPPHRMNQWSNQASGRGWGRGGRGFRGRSNGRQPPNSPAGDSWRDGSTKERRGPQGRGQRGGRTVSAKDQPHLFAKKSMVEDPWRALEATRTGTI